MAKKKRKNYFTKLSKETVDTLCQELARGVPIKHSCTLAGISKETYYYWKKKVKELPEDESEYTDFDELLVYFDEQVEKGLAMAVATRVEHIRTDNSWQSSAWWLERMAHEDFGRKQTIDANVDAKVKTADISKFFDDDKVLQILNEEKEDTDDLD